MLDPARAAATLRALEGGEDEPDAAERGEGQDGEDARAQRDRDDDARWKGARDVFASAGDDGLVKVWRVES